MPRSRLLDPSTIDDLLMFRLTRLLAVAGAPVIRLCEGRYGITRREWRVVGALAQNGPMQSSALAERIHLDRGRTSKTITDLARKDIVRRTPRAGDRRKVDVALTSAGQSIYDALFPEVVRINQQLLAAMFTDEVDHLDRLLAALQQRADRGFDIAGLPKANRRQAGRQDKAGG